MSKPKEKNTAPALRLSSIRFANQLDLTPGKPPMLVCRECKRWLVPMTHPAGTFLPVHRSDDLADVKTRDRAQGHRPRCGESWREVVLDVTSEEWTEQAHHAAAAVRHRRGSRTEYKPQPPVPTPVFRMAR